MFLALLIIAAVFVVIAFVQKNWIYGGIAVACIILALLLGGDRKLTGRAHDPLAGPSPVLVLR